MSGRGTLRTVSKARVEKQEREPVPRPHSAVHRAPEGLDAPPLLKCWPCLYVIYRMVGTDDPRPVRRVIETSTLSSPYLIYPCSGYL